MAACKWSQMSPATRKYFPYDSDRQGHTRQDQYFPYESKSGEKGGQSGLDAYITYLGLGTLGTQARTTDPGFQR